MSKAVSKLRYHWLVPFACAIGAANVWHDYGYHGAQSLHIAGNFGLPYAIVAGIVGFFAAR
jgi:hypothetical protein